MGPRGSIFLILVISFTIIYGSVAFNVQSPKASEPFMAFGVFSKSGNLSSYLPGGGPSVGTNQTASWQLHVTNNMGTVQFVRIVFRLGNLTTESATATLPAASIPQIGAQEVFVANQDTVSLNFDWKILASKGASTTFLQIQINNGAPIWSAVGALSGHDFRMIFELWTFDAPSGSFHYGWKNGGFFVGSPLQVWFNFRP